MRFLLVDQITDSIPGERIHGLKHVTADDFYLLPQADGHWCFMPSLIGETLGQLAAWNVMQYKDFRLRPVAGVVGKVHIYRPVMLGETLHLQADLERLDDTAVLYNARASVNGENVFTIESALGPLLPMEDFIDPEQAKAQYNEIYRLCDVQDTPDIKYTVERRPGMVCATPAYDQLLEFTPGESMKMAKLISRQAPFFPDHFPRKPVLPMTVLLECGLSMAKDFLEKSAFQESWRLIRIQRVKMNEFVHPGDSLQTELRVKSYSEGELVLIFKTEMRGKRVCVMEAIFSNRE